MYAQLVHSQLDAVLTFLSSVPGPTGNSALHFVMSEWVSKQHLFYGSYETKVSLMALGKLLQYGVNNNDDRLNEITVRGDEVFSEGGPRTRSSRATRPVQYTSVPLLAKISKLLLLEMGTQLEMAEESEEEEEESDDELSQDGDSGLNTSGGIFS